jgi:hypothetical protein
MNAMLCHMGGCMPGTHQLVHRAVSYLHYLLHFDLQEKDLKNFQVGQQQCQVISE